MELENIIKTTTKIVKKNLKSHLIESTALLAESTPVFAANETAFAKMPVDVSMHARIWAIGLTFAGMGIAYAKGRDCYRKLFHITDRTSERIQSLNDAIYTGLFNLVVAPPIYFVSGERDPKKIALGTLGSVTLGLFNGLPLGYSVDVYRDLTGLKDCERPSYPDILKRQDPKTKKGLAALVTAGTIALTAGIYAVAQRR